MRDYLPVDDVVDDVVLALQRCGVVVITAPPGSGKTTRVPPALLDRCTAGGAVWLVQPRRVAARLAARRIAEERGCAPGAEVGWRVRFEDRTTKSTRLVAMTDGILLRALQDDPFLDGVDVVVLDEVHERGLDLDLALALLVELRRDARPDLQLVVMSATVDADSFAAFLGGEVPAPVVRADGQLFPVDIRYADRAVDGPLAPAVAAAIRSVFAETAPRGGHVLAFLPGQGEIRATAERLQDLDAEVCLLHGQLTLADQAKVLAPRAYRTVVLATNIAETSVTFPGVVAVVDSGAVRRARHDVATDRAVLLLGEISRASADQRAGRAGRTGPGIALRLWTQDQHRVRRAFEQPEVQVADLAPVVLRLLDLGVSPTALRWLEAPPEAAVKRAFQVLGDLGAIDGEGLSPLGRALAALPLHPRVGRVVWEGVTRHCAPAAATLAALLSEGDPWRGASSGDDLHGLVTRVEQGRGGGRALDDVRRVRDELLRRCAAPKGAATRTGGIEEDLLACVLAGFPGRLGRRRGDGSSRFKLASGRGAVLRDPEVAAHGTYIVAMDIQGKAGAEDSVSLAVVVPEAMVLALATWSLEVALVEGKAVADEVGRVGSLVVGRRRPRGPVDDAAVEAVLVDAVRRSWTTSLQWTDELREWLRRVRFVAHHCPDAGLPALSDDDILDAIPALCRGHRSLMAVAKVDVREVLEAEWTYAQRRSLDTLAPERLRLPSGSEGRLAYGAPAEAPVLAARMQQVFGMNETPRVAGGRVPVLMHLLAPNNRPAQITSDLHSFWRTTWSELRKDLRGRYPKHAWPEDPTTAQPEDRPRRNR